MIAAVLIGGYLVSNALRDSGKDDAVVAAERTAAREEEQGTVTPGASRTARPMRTGTSAARTVAAPLVAYDLGRDEDRGGHTLSRHVGKTDAELRARLERETDISAASSYTDQQTAEETVAAALLKGAKTLRAWENRTGTRPNLVLRYTAKQVLGRSVERGAKGAVDAKEAVVVLKWTGRDWFVLTSYPEAR